MPTARIPDRPPEAIPIDTHGVAIGGSKRTVKKGHSSYAGSVEPAFMPSAGTAERRPAAAAAVGEPAGRSKVWSRIATALRVSRRKPDRPQYPPRRPAFMADAAMEREMHRL